MREAWKAAGDKQLSLGLGLLTVRDGTRLVPPFLRCPCTCSRYCAAFGALTWPSEPRHHLLCSGLRAPTLVSRGLEGAEKRSRVLLSQDLAAPRACLTSPPFPAGGLWKSWQGFILSASWVQSRQSLCQGRLYPKGVVTGRPDSAELSRRLRPRCSPDFTPVLLRALPLTPATCTESGACSG